MKDGKPDFYFSQGPWKAIKHQPDKSDYSVQPFLTVNDIDGNEIAVLNGNPNRFTHEELNNFYANAILISKSPELFDMLEKISELDGIENFGYAKGICSPSLKEKIVRLLDAARGK